ncbi:hypothetical protein [Plantactinospora sonchi]|uniref:Uncharacterized protein n=1 Tax=Plantactinospora sonchi TaxID=1544735 RepID=A0ABU7RQW0_9ACTN
MSVGDVASDGTGVSANPPPGGLLFPVGHYLGAVYPGAEEPPAYHRLRVGDSVVRLFSEEEFGLWVLAHGLPGRPVDQPWTLAALAESVRRRDGRDVTPLLHELLAEGALAEVTPGTGDAVAFAHAHRFRSLLTGLGMSPDDPERFLLGLLGRPLAMVDEPTYELWQWAPLHASIWDVCRALAEVDPGPGGRPGDPELRLTEVLGRLQVLIASSAGYLDEVRR